VILVGIDVGTTGLKAVALSPAGRLLRERTERYATRFAGAAAEQDAGDWWGAACAVLPDVVDGDDVLGLAVTCQAPTLVAVDAAGAPRGPALTWIDRRAVAESAEIAALADAGRNGADPFFGTAKLLWWARHRTDLDGAAAVLGANGFVVRQLCGVDSLDESTAGMLQGWDGGFPPALAAAVPVGLLPTAVPCVDVVGTVSAAAAKATGLPAGTPVAAGGIDSIGAALEAGVFTPADPPVEMTGFSTVTMRAAARGSHVPGMIHTRHAVAGTDLVLSAQTSTGSVVDWVHGLTGTTYGDATTRVPAGRPGRLLLVPSFAGERTPTWTPRARGAVVGLDLSCTAGDLLLAVYEGTALALRDNLERLDSAGGATPTLRSSGGGVKNRAWMQVKADVLGRPVQVPVAGHGAAVGAGLLAGLAVGVWSDPQELRALSDPVRETYQPDPGRHRAYSRRLALFRELQASLPAYDELADDETDEESVR
jgi:xylulokinase